MFEGIFKASIDSSWRTILPLQLRKVLIDARVIITNSRPFEYNNTSHHGVSVYPFLEWQEFERRVASSSFDETTKKTIERQFMAPALECVVDTTGRVLIPAQLRSHCNLDSMQKVVMVGMIDHIEIWSMVSWVKIEPAIKDRLARLIDGEKKVRF